MTEQKGMLRKVMELDVNQEMRAELLSTANMLRIDKTLDIPFLVDNDLLSQEAANVFLKDVVGSDSGIIVNDNEVSNEPRIRAVV